MLHHKLYPENPVPPIARLEVNHGYGMPTVNLGSRANGWRWRAGLGVVVAHPEGVVGGRPIGARRTFLGGAITSPAGSADGAECRAHALGGAGARQTW